MKAAVGGREGDAGGHRSIYGRGAFALFSNPIENASEGQSKRIREKEKRMECDKRKMPLMLISSEQFDVERHVPLNGKATLQEDAPAPPFTPLLLHFSAPLTVEHSVPFHRRLSAGRISATIPKMAPSDVAVHTFHLSTAWFCLSTPHSFSYCTKQHLRMQCGLL